MTWYANEIIANVSPALLDAIQNETALAAHAYLIKETIEYQLNGEDYSYQPPAGGLLVIRPVCDSDSHCAEWHNEAILSWHKLAIAEEIEVLTPQDFGDYYDSNVADEFPPKAFFAYLKQLAHRTQTNLVFFYCFMWGGATEFEYLWQFGEREQAALVIEPEVQSQVVSIKADRKPELSKSDLLSEALAYLGSPIASPFWILHTREFNWEAYRLYPDLKDDAR